MTRTLYDAVTPANIPASTSMVAGYIDGRYAWQPRDWARFPSAVKVRIAVFPSTLDGDVLDCEQGDATPAQCPGWVRARRAVGADPTVYCSQAAWQSVINAFTAAGVAQPHYWIAAYPGGGSTNLPVLAGIQAVAHQYIDTGAYDVSVVADFWPGVDIGVQPNYQPSTGFEEDEVMPAYIQNSKRDTLVVFGDGRVVACVSGPPALPAGAGFTVVGDPEFADFAAHGAAAEAALKAQEQMPVLLTELITVLKALPGAQVDLPPVLGRWSFTPDPPVSPTA